SDWFSESAQATPGYATMTPEQLFALPVPQWAAENCHLYLCSPNNFKPICHRLVEHWGFAYKSTLTWKKPRWGQGQYFRNQTEHVLFAVRGELRTRSVKAPLIHVLHRDYETRSVLELPIVGLWRYAADERTEVRCCAYALDDEPVQLWVPGN